MEQRSVASVEDDVQVNLVGPGPEWGSDEERPSPPGNDAPRYDENGERNELGDLSSDELARLAEAHDLATSSEPEIIDALSTLGVGIVKGPGPQWATDEEGRYVNRG